MSHTTMSYETCECDECAATRDVARDIEIEGPIPGPIRNCKEPPMTNDGFKALAKKTAAEAGVPLRCVTLGYVQEDETDEAPWFVAIVFAKNNQAARGYGADLLAAATEALKSLADYRESAKPKYDREGFRR